MILLFAASAAPAQPWGDPSVTVGVDSRAFGTWETRWDTDWRGQDGWTWGAGVQVSIPWLLVIKGGGFDTVDLEVEGRTEWEFPAGWFAKGRLATGLSTQTQVLGSLTSWTGGLSLEPGYRGDWGEVWLLVRPQATLITLVRPSTYTAATFEERYQDEPSGSMRGSLILGLSSVRLLAGAGIRITVIKALALGLTLGVYPPRSSDGVGWMDGFSFGEIPLYSSLECRIRL